MSEVVPGTRIYLYRNVPLTPDYEHTVYYPSIVAQQQAFGLITGTPQVAFPPIVLQDNTFQRVNKNTIRVAASHATVFDCNYVIFCNDSYEARYFYAFITKVNYINNATTEIEYQLDVMQTWFIRNQTGLGNAFVVREHAIDDTIGKNIEPEPVEVGEYMFNTFHQMFSTTRLDFVLGYAYANANQNTGGIYDSVYSGSQLCYFKSLPEVTPGTTNATDDAINRKINALLTGNYPANITNLYCIPGEFMESGISQGEEIPKSYNIRSKTYALDGIGTHLNGYIPRNKKLFTYPYNFLHINNGSGSELNVRYELFDLGVYPGASITNFQPVFECYCSILQPVGVLGYFTGYKNSDDITTISETLLLSDFPMCSFALDSYAAWVAQNSLSRGYNGILFASKVYGGVLSAVASTYGQDPMGAMHGIQNSLGTVVNYMNADYKASVALDTVKGNSNNGSIMAVNKKQTFFYGRMSVKREKAEIIDEFFDKFGYATNRLKTPNISGRPYWNYVKCIDPEIRGAIPADDLVKIIEIFKNGITFWKNLANVGNYSLDNRMV